MANKKKSRKWVVKAIIGFVAALLLLTFFSNTIMNMTIPKVIGAYAVRGNLSYTNSATGTIVVDNKTEVKGVEGRTVDEVLLGNYDYVEPGTVVMTLKPAEDSEELATLRTTLRDLEREAEYDSRSSSSTDYSSYTQAISDAESLLNQANETLAQAQGRDATIAAANDVINSNQATVVALQAEVSSASDTVEDINQQIDAINAQIETLETNINVFVVLGTPTPTPVDPAAAAVPPTADETVPSETAAPSETASSEETGETGETTESAPATPTPTPAPDTSAIDDLCAQRDELLVQRGQLESQLASAQARLDDASGRLAEVNGIIEEAQSAIEAAESLPSVSDAQNSVTQAQNSLNSARRTYSDAQVEAGINADREADKVNDRNQQIEETRKKIEEIEASMEVNEIVATDYGYIYDMAAEAGAVLEAKSTVFTIIPDESSRQCSVTFNFDAKVAQNFYVGMTLSCDSYWLSKVEIINIKPDPENPRESRLVKCSVDSYAYPGESITVVADRANSDYDRVISSSAINEDNSGKFVYIIESSSGPLGDKYTVKRVDVTVEATDGSMSAISAQGNELGDNMIVIRSEEPLHDGDRVRLEDYTKK